MSWPACTAEKIDATRMTRAQNRTPNAAGTTQAPTDSPLIAAASGMRCAAAVETAWAVTVTSSSPARTAPARPRNVVACANPL
ncbi:Uncharacterised protein [Mycobacteroides abscessus]|nr:Uncharacterised protein [Mycobacteroides abscessus]